MDSVNKRLLSFGNVHNKRLKTFDIFLAWISWPLSIHATTIPLNSNQIHYKLELETKAKTEGVYPWPMEVNVKLGPSCGHSFPALL